MDGQEGDMDKRERGDKQRERWGREPNDREGNVMSAVYYCARGHVHALTKETQLCVNVHWVSCLVLCTDSQSLETGHPVFSLCACFA